MLIASLPNRAVKRLRLLHEQHGRAQQGLFLVEGMRLVEEALEGRSGRVRRRAHLPCG